MDPVWAGVPLWLRQNLGGFARLLVNPARGGLAEKSARPLRLALSAAAQMRTTGAHWLVLLTAPRSAFGGPASDRAERAYGVLQQVVTEYLGPALGTADATPAPHAPDDAPPAAVVSATVLGGPAPTASAGAPADAGPGPGPAGRDGTAPGPVLAEPAAVGGPATATQNGEPAGERAGELGDAVREVVGLRAILAVTGADATAVQTALAQLLSPGTAGLPVVYAGGRDRSSLVRALFTQLGLDRHKPQPRALGAVVDLIAAELRRAPRRLVIVPAAHELRTDALQTLYSLWSSGRFPLVLAGDGRLDKVLGRPALASLKSCVFIRHRVETATPDVPATPAEQLTPSPAPESSSPASAESVSAPAGLPAPAVLQVESGTVPAAGPVEPVPAEDPAAAEPGGPAAEQQTPPRVPPAAPAAAAHGPAVPVAADAPEARASAAAPAPGALVAAAVPAPASGPAPATLHEARGALPKLIRAAAKGTPALLTRESDHAVLTTPATATALGWDLSGAATKGIADARKKLGDLIHLAAQGRPQVLRRHTTPVAVLLPGTADGTPRPPGTPATAPSSGAAPAPSADRPGALRPRPAPPGAAALEASGPAATTAGLTPAPASGTEVPPPAGAPGPVTPMPTPVPSRPVEPAPAAADASAAEAPGAVAPAAPAPNVPADATTPTALPSAVVDAQATAVFPTPAVPGGTEPRPAPAPAGTPGAVPAGTTPDTPAPAEHPSAAPSGAVVAEPADAMFSTPDPTGSADDAEPDAASAGTTSDTPTPVPVVRARRRLAPLGQALDAVLTPTTAAAPDGEPAATRGARGVLTGIPGLDQALGGLQPGRFYLVAADPGTGGSLIAAGAARTAALTHHRPVLYAASGLTRADVAARIVAAHLTVDYHRLRTGQLTETEQTDVTALHHQLAAAHLYIDDGTGLTPDVIAESVTDLPGVALLVVDRLQSADDPRLPLSGPRLADAAQALAHLARTRHFPVLAVLDTTDPEEITALGLDVTLTLTPDPDDTRRVRLTVTERDLGPQAVLTLHADRAHARLTDPVEFDPYAGIRSLAPEEQEPATFTDPHPAPEATHPSAEAPEAPANSTAGPGPCAWPSVAVPGNPATVPAGDAAPAVPDAPVQPARTSREPATHTPPTTTAPQADPVAAPRRPARPSRAAGGSGGGYAGRDYSYYTGQIARAVDQALQEHGGDVEAATEALVKKAVPNAMALFKETRANANYEHTVYPKLLEILRKKTKDGADEIWEGRHNWTNIQFTDQLHGGALGPVTVDALDTNASYMSAFKTHLPVGALKHNPLGGFDPKTSGVHLLTQRPAWHHPHLPDPLGNRREPGPVVLTDATVRLLIRCAGYDLCDPPVIAENWISGGSEGLLEKFRRVLTEARHAALEREAAGYADGTVAVEYIKAMYSKFTSTLGESNANLDIRRPEWMHIIRSQAFANLWYKARRAHNNGFTVVRVRGTDELHVTGGNWRDVFTEGRFTTQMKQKNQYTLPRN